MTVEDYCPISEAYREMRKVGGKRDGRDRMRAIAQLDLGRAQESRGSSLLVAILDIPYFQ